MRASRELLYIHTACMRASWRRRNNNIREGTSKTRLGRRYDLIVSMASIIKAMCMHGSEERSMCGMHAVSEPELLVWSARSTYVNSFISMNPYIYIAEYTCNRSRRERERRMAQDLHGCMDRVQELAHACSTGRASRERARPPRPSATASAACQEHRSYTCMPTATARLAAACARPGVGPCPPCALCRNRPHDARSPSPRARQPMRGSRPGS